MYFKKNMFLLYLNTLTIFPFVMFPCKINFLTFFLGRCHVPLLKNAKKSAFWGNMTKSITIFIII